VAVRSHPPSPVELARDHLSGQVRLRDDALKQFARTASDRVDAERAHGDSLAAHAVALSASTSAPADERVLGFLSLAVARVQRDRWTLDAAIRAHEEAKANLATFEGHVARAERDYERVQLEGELTDPRRRDRRRARGRKIFALLSEAFDELEAERKAISEETAIAARARALGSSIEPADGLGEAAGFAAAMLEQGVDLAGSGEPSALRWAFDVDRIALTGGGGPPGALINLATIVARARSNPPSANGTNVLRQELAAWADHRSAVECHRAQHAQAEADHHRQEPAFITTEKARLAKMDHQIAERKRLGPHLVGSR
jgi:hypothetical protein